MVCRQDTFEDLSNAGAFHSLRPEIDHANWEISEELGDRYLSIFRLDGAHILSSPDLKILAIAQHIGMPNNLGLAQQGAGRAAAIYVSKLLSGGGIVIKVSSDGPVTIYQQGEVLEEIEPVHVTHPDST